MEAIEYFTKFNSNNQINGQIWDLCCQIKPDPNCFHLSRGQWLVGTHLAIFIQKNPGMQLPVKLPESIITFAKDYDSRLEQSQVRNVQSFNSGTTQDTNGQTFNAPEGQLPSPVSTISEATAPIVTQQPQDYNFDEDLKRLQGLTPPEILNDFSSVPPQHQPWNRAEIPEIVNVNLDRMTPDQQIDALKQEVQSEQGMENNKIQNDAELAPISENTLEQQIIKDNLNSSFEAKTNEKLILEKQYSTKSEAQTPVIDSSPFGESNINVAPSSISNQEYIQQVTSNIGDPLSIIKSFTSLKNSYDTLLEASTKEHLFHHERMTAIQSQTSRKISQAVEFFDQIKSVIQTREETVQAIKSEANKLRGIVDNFQTRKNLKHLSTVMSQTDINTMNQAKLLLGIQPTIVQPEDGFFEDSDKGEIKEKTPLDVIQKRDTPQEETVWQGDERIKEESDFFADAGVEEDFEEEKQCEIQNECEGRDDLESTNGFLTEISNDPSEKYVDSITTQF